MRCFLSYHQRQLQTRSRRSISRRRRRCHESPRMGIESRKLKIQHQQVSNRHRWYIRVSNSSLSKYTAFTNHVNLQRRKSSSHRLNESLSPSTTNPNQIPSPRPSSHRQHTNSNHLSLGIQTTPTMAHTRSYDVVSQDVSSQ